VVFEENMTIEYPKESSTPIAEVEMIEQQIQTDEVKKENTVIYKP
jgi:hypothetical protein